MEVAFFTIKSLVNSLVFTLLGMGLLAGGFYLVDRLVPGHLWREIIEEHNTALAIVIGAMCLGLSIIIAAAIH
jgi:putative membrane protein